MSIVGLLLLYLFAGFVWGYALFGSDKPMFDWSVNISMPPTPEPPTILRAGPLRPNRALFEDEVTQPGVTEMVKTAKKNLKKMEGKS